MRSAIVLVGLFAACASPLPAGHCPRGARCDGGVPDGGVLDGSVPDGSSLPDGSGSDGGGCTTSPDSCPTGQFCDAGTCAAGCKGSGDCSGDTPLCDLARHTCVECLGAGDCPSGKLCSPSGRCVDGCDPSAGKGCPGTQTCCNKLCIDTATDELNCGGCSSVCDTTHAASATCVGGLCSYACSTGYDDCVKTGANLDGCETHITSSVSHCGGCGQACSTANNTARTCVARVCSYTCEAGFSDCVKTGANLDGCETAATSCGACTCGSGETCASMCCLYDSIGLTLGAGNANVVVNRSGTTAGAPPSRYDRSTGAAGPERIYAVTPTQDMKISVTLNATFDSVLYEKAGTCPAPGLTSGSPFSDAPGKSNETIGWAATANTTYYLFVDGYNAAASGSFALTITGCDLAKAGCP